MLLIFTSGVIIASSTAFVMTFLLRRNPGVYFRRIPLSHFLLCGSAYVLFFYSQGRVYSLTILGNFLVGLPESQTPTTVAHGTAVTTVVFHVDYQTSANARAVLTYDDDNGGTEPLDLFDMDTVKSKTHSD
ncbi:hypothetical protein FB451DRAFT_1165278 [Mycena latifolia]|nr:hypothetical protein FB451DRAFT_1165278 [Mycena latifolia]